MKKKDILKILDITCYSIILVGVIFIIIFEFNFNFEILKCSVLLLIIGLVLLLVLQICKLVFAFLYDTKLKKSKAETFQTQNNISDTMNNFSTPAINLNIENETANAENIDLEEKETNNANLVETKSLSENEDIQTSDNIYAQENSQQEDEQDNIEQNYEQSIAQENSQNNTNEKEKNCINNDEDFFMSKKEKIYGIIKTSVVFLIFCWMIYIYSNM